MMTFDDTPVTGTGITLPPDPPRSLAGMVAENFAHDLLAAEDRLVDAEQRAESFRFALQQAVHRLAAVERDLRTARATIGALREELRALRQGRAAA